MWVYLAPPTQFSYPNVDGLQTANVEMANMTIDPVQQPWCDIYVNDTILDARPADYQLECRHWDLQFMTAGTSSWMNAKFVTTAYQFVFNEDRNCPIDEDCALDPYNFTSNVPWIYPSGTGAIDFHVSHEWLSRELFNTPGRPFLNEPERCLRHTSKKTPLNTHY